MAEAWMPDAFVFALGATLLSAAAALAVDPALRASPASLMRAVREAAPATSGVLLQFPFDGGIFGIMAGTAIAAVPSAAKTQGSHAARCPAYFTL